MTEVTLSVRTLSGEEVVPPSRFSSSLKVHGLQNRVQELTGIPSLSQRIVQGNVVLPPHASLEEALVEDGAQLTMVTLRSVVYTASADLTAKMWDVDTGECIRTFAGHQGVLNSASLSPDGSQLLSASSDGYIRVWCIATGECKMAFKCNDSCAIMSAAFSRDVQTVLTASEDHTAKIWSLAEQACVSTFTGHCAAVLSASFSPCGERILTSSRDGSVRLWKREDSTMIHVFQGVGYTIYPHPSPPLFSKNGELLLTLWDDRTVDLNETVSGERAQTFQTQGAGMMFAATFCPDESQLLTVSQDGGIRFWSRRTGECIRRFQGHATTACTLAFSSDGILLATGSIDRTCRLWDHASGECKRIFTGHTAAIMSVACS